MDFDIELMEHKLIWFKMQQQIMECGVFMMEFISMEVDGFTYGARP